MKNKNITLPEQLQITIEKS